MKEFTNLSKQEQFNEIDSLINKKAELISARDELQDEYEKVCLSHDRYKFHKKNREAELQIQLVQMSPDELQENFNLAKLTESSKKSIIQLDSKYQNKCDGEINTKNKKLALEYQIQEANECINIIETEINLRMAFI